MRDAFPDPPRLGDSPKLTLPARQLTQGTEISQESEIVYPVISPAVAAEVFDSAERDPTAGASSREARSLAHGEEYESQELDQWEPPGPQSLSAPGLELTLAAFGRELRILLRRDSRFLAQKFMVESRLNARKAPQESAASAERSCYYSGTVANATGSIASFSTCGGLTGFIQLTEDFLFIEPVNRSQAATGEAHRVYRRKRSQDENQMSQTYCAVLSDKQKKRSKKLQESGRGKRYSYKLAHEYIVETLVVADSAMVSHHGSEATKKFVLTIMNMVFNLFQHKSLGVGMTIRLSKLVLLHETPADMYIGHHGEKMLESFCQWQQNEFGKKSNRGGSSATWREDLPSVDTAILITRENTHYSSLQHPLVAPMASSRAAYTNYNVHDALLVFWGPPYCKEGYIWRLGGIGWDKQLAIHHKC
ncbi:ATS19 metalloproteinase, partial [Polypterus senegalus]